MRGGLASSSGAAGAYHRDDGELVLTIDRSYQRESAQLVAVIAHELGHVRLLGENRITVGQWADHEPLTDLLTVYLRLGVFTANAALSFSKSTNLRCTAWSAQRLGYITEQMFGYEL